MPAEVGEPTHGSKCRSCGASDFSIWWISNDQIVAVANFEREGIPAADDLRHALAFEAVLSSKHPSQEPLRKCGEPRINLDSTKPGEASLAGSVRSHSAFNVRGDKQPCEGNEEGAPAP